MKKNPISFCYFDGLNSGTVGFDRLIFYFFNLANSHMFFRMFGTLEGHLSLGYITYPN